MVLSVNLKSVYNKSSNKMKGTMGVDQLSPFAVTIVVLIMIVAIGAILLTQMQSTQTANSYAYNITGQGLSALDSFGDYFGLIVLVGIFAVLIGLILYFFVFRTSRGGA